MKHQGLHGLKVMQHLLPLLDSLILSTSFFSAKLHVFKLFMLFLYEDQIFACCLLLTIGFQNEAESHPTFSIFKSTQTLLMPLCSSMGLQLPVDGVHPDAL